jgi:2'-5' RNA ligase
MTFRRYAVYDLPDREQFAESGARWLGWNVAAGRPAEQPAFDDIRSITETPRKYGFHATLKPPFRLADGYDLDTLSAALETLASSTSAAFCSGLQISALGKFLAITPEGDTQSINNLAFHCVKSLDGFRAPLNENEMARRRRAALSQRQEELLTEWGYPYVAEEFNYHITLSGVLEKDKQHEWREHARQYFKLPSPYEIKSLALVGERDDGHFELIRRYTLAG